MGMARWSRLAGVDWSNDHVWTEFGQKHAAAFSRELFGRGSLVCENHARESVPAGDSMPLLGPKGVAELKLVQHRSTC